MTEKPKKVWIDSSEYTHIVVCDHCTHSYGPWFNRREAITYRITHGNEHYRARQAEAALNRYYFNKETK